MIEAEFEREEEKARVNSHARHGRGEKMRRDGKGTREASKYIVRNRVNIS